MLNAPSLYPKRYTHTHTHPFNGPLSGTTRVSRYQKGKTNLDFTQARASGWQWHQLGHMQVCTSLQTENHGSTPPLRFLQAGCPSCRPTNSVKALKAKRYNNDHIIVLKVVRTWHISTTQMRWARTSFALDPDTSIHVLEKNAHEPSMKMM